MALLDHPMDFGFHRRDHRRGLWSHHSDQGNRKDERMAMTRIIALTVLFTASISAPIIWFEIDRSPPLEYQAAYFDVPEAKPGQKVKLTLKIRWPRTNCSTDLERTFIGWDGTIHKIVDAEGHSTVRLGPPPPAILVDGVATSTREVTLPDDLPDGVATHSPNAWLRCTSPAKKWGDYLTDIWPVFVGPAGAEAKIIIRR